MGLAGLETMLGESVSKSQTTVMSQIYRQMLRNAKEFKNTLSEEEKLNKVMSNNLLTNALKLVELDFVPEARRLLAEARSIGNR